VPQLIANAAAEATTDVEAASTSASSVVFISFAGSERTLADELKIAIETLFPSIEVFVSSAPDSIGAGAKWINSIESALKRCVIVVVIASPTSIQRPWVNFEAGAGWIRDVPVIPACHSGLSPKAIPAPLGFLQAVELTDEADLRERLAPEVARVSGTASQSFDFAALASRLREHVAAIASQEGLGEGSPQPPEPPAGSIVAFDSEWLDEQRQVALASLQTPSATPPR
jgi:hypothetical protein